MPGVLLAAESLDDTHYHNDYYVKAGSAFVVEKDSLKVGFLLRLISYCMLLLTYVATIMPICGHFFTRADFGVKEDSKQLGLEASATSQHK